MMTPSTEDARLAALRAYDILDTDPEAEFERVVRVAKTLVKTPLVSITFVDRDRVWAKANDGEGPKQLPRQGTFCDALVGGAGDLMVVEDAEADPRFSTATLGVDPARARFYAGAALVTRGGERLGALCCLDSKPRTLTPEQGAALVDLSHIVADSLELRQTATHDGLTKALQRSAFLETAQRDIDRALRERQPLACLAIDVDHFKRVNDTFGHAAGDEVLRRVARLCQATLRPSDYFGRLGGEEFGFMLRNTTLAQATVIAERLRSRIAAEVFAFEAGTIRVTASFGVTGLIARRRTNAKLLAEADAALYRAKRGGRNACVVSDAAEASPDPAGTGAAEPECMDRVA